MGVEPTTLCLQGRCSFHLSYTPIIKKYSKTATPIRGYCLFAGRVSHFPERYYYITALVGAVARLRVCLYTSLCWHCELFVFSICLSVGTYPHLPTVVFHVAFYWWPPHRSLTSTTFFIFRITDKLLDCASSETPLIDLTERRTLRC